MTAEVYMCAQERLWRLRAKRAWIREQLQALRGFPDVAADADYAEPWSDALGKPPHRPPSSHGLAETCTAAIFLKLHRPCTLRQALLLV